jgi:hypothetical protein
MVITNANCKGNWHLCAVNGHFEQFVVVVMHGMLKIFPTCVPPMNYATINLRVRRQMIRRVPFQRPEAASRFLSKITCTPTLRGQVMWWHTCQNNGVEKFRANRHSLVVPHFHQVCQQKYVLSPRHSLYNLSVEKVHDCIFCYQNSSIAMYPWFV